MIEGRCRAAVVADAGFRKTEINGQAVCLLTDVIVERHGAYFSSWRFGRVVQPERVPSREVSLHPGLFDALRAMLIWTIRDLKDALALWRLMSGYPKPMRKIPGLGMCELPHWVWFTYSFIAIKLAYSPAARFAAQFDELHIVNFVNTKSMALVRAFRASGKPVCEIQHGLIGPTHPGYSNTEFWRMDTRVSPTRFLVWNQSTKDFLEAVARRPADVRDFDDSYYVPQHDSGPKDGRRCVLLTLQWGMSLPEPITRMVEEFTDVRWIVRPHPRDPVPPLRRRDCARLSTLDHVTITDPASPLVLDLRCCDLHLTENSSVVIEAAAVGRKSLFWDETQLEAFASEIRSGLAVCRPPELIPRLVRRALACGASPELSWRD